MKFLLFLCLSVVIVSNCKAQYSLLGETRQYIRGKMSESGYKLIDSDAAKDGTVYDSYEIIKNRFQGVFYFKSDKCSGYKEVANKDMLINQIKSLNARFVKVDGFHWINVDATMKINLWIPSTGSDFEVNYTKL